MALSATTAIVAVALYVFASLLSIAPVALELPRSNPLAGVTTAFPIGLLLPAIIVGVVIGVVLFASLGIRSGGFVTGTYLALVANRPLDLIFAALAAMVTYLFVRFLLMPRLLLFGRRKLSTMILVGAIVSWAGQIAITAGTNGAYAPWQGFTVISLLVPALLANDAQRQGVERTVWGATIVALGVYGAANLLDGLRTFL